MLYLHSKRHFSSCILVTKWSSRIGIEYENTAVERKQQ